MNPQDPLAQLQPLRQPDVIGWWPPAPGWWIVVAVLLAGLLLLGWRLLRRYRANAYRRRALAGLEALHRQLGEDGDTRAFVVNTNALLKSVALQAYPRRQVAAASGANWLAFLRETCRGDTAALDERFVAALYRQDAPAPDAHQLHRAAAQWIRRHEVAR